MKNLLSTLAAALCMLTVTSCATMSMAELRPTGAIPDKLPVLEPDVDIYSVESAYSIGNDNSSGITFDLSTDDGDRSTTYGGLTLSSGRIRRDSRIQDVVTIFTRDVQNNISSPVGETRGTAYCRIAAGNGIFTGWPLAFISVFTGFIPNLFGLPVGFCSTELDVDVEIYDLNGNCVGTYNAIGKARTAIAMYYGYGYDASRKSAADAFKRAMTDIKAQIAADSERLNKALR